MFFFSSSQKEIFATNIDLGLFFFFSIFYQHLYTIDFFFCEVGDVYAHSVNIEINV